MKRLGSISATREVEGGDGDTGRLFIGQAGRFRCLFLLFSIFLSKRVTYVNPSIAWPVCKKYGKTRSHTEIVIVQCITSERDA